MRYAASLLLILGLVLGFLYLNKSKYSDSNLADKYFYKHGAYVVKNEEDAQLKRRSAKEFSMANKFFKEENYKSALPIYNTLRINNNPYQDYAEWNMIMCKLKSKEKGDHVKMLNRIIKNPDHLMHSKAKLLDEELNNFYRKLPF